VRAALLNFGNFTILMISKELAEIAGIFAADGSIQKAHLCIWGNITEDRAYYDQVLTKLFKKEFKITPRCHEKRSNSVYGFYICDKKVIKTFNKLGFNAGKKTYTVKIPEKIIKSNNPEIWTSFIRGFFDGDGCLNFSKRKGTASQFKKEHHTYPRIFLSSRSFELIRQIHKLLTKLEIRATFNIHKPSYEWEKPAAVITIRGVNMLEKWIQLIGMNNQASFTKYLLWKKQGFCPANTTLQERFRMIA